MTKPSLALAALLAATAWPVTAAASCYFVYGPDNQLVYRSTITPVDLSKPISEGLRSRYSGAHLVMVPDETGCPDLLTSGESKLFAALGFATRGGPGSAIEASPLFRNASPRPGSSAVGATAAPGDAAAEPRPPQRRAAPRPK
jgi:hypothetical protein